jgi:restriction system protein
MARLWLVRLGRHGEQEAHALANSELVLGFQVGDLSKAKTRDALLEIAKGAFAETKPNTQRHFAAQLNQFCNVAQEGDFVVVPLKTKRQIALGKISGPYVNLNGKPSRPVAWLKPDLARSIFQPDLLYSFGAFMTVCEISRNNAVRVWKRS